MVVNVVHLAGDQFICGIPKGSVLGPVPFNAFINDLDAKVECMLSKYANYMKVGGALDPDKRRCRGI